MKRHLLLLTASIFAIVSAMGNGERAEWIFNKKTVKQYGNEFATKGIYRSSYGTPSECRFVRAKKSKAETLYETNKNGFPIAYNAKCGDAWVFEMPVKQVAAGTTIDFWVMFFTEQKEVRHRFMLEYLDGKRWLPAIEPKKDGKIAYNCDATASDKYARQLWTSIKLNNAIADGSITIRLRLVDKEAQAIRLGGSGSCQSAHIIVYDEKTPRDTTSALFIGNSYTYYHLYPAIFKEIAWREGHAIDCSIYFSGGYTMKAHMANPVSRETVAKGGYEYAFFQDQSVLPTLSGTEDDKSMEANMAKIIGNARNASPGVKPIIELTWGRKHGNNGLGKYKVYDERYPQFFASYQAMQDRLTEVITAEAEQVGATLSPVGLAWQIVCRERPDIDLYSTKDAHHPSYAGQYLAASVAYLTVWGEKFGDNPITGKLDELTAAYLRAVAERVVFGGER